MGIAVRQRLRPLLAAYSAADLSVQRLGGHRDVGVIARAVRAVAHNLRQDVCHPTRTDRDVGVRERAAPNYAAGSQQLGTI